MLEALCTDLKKDETRQLTQFPFGETTKKKRKNNEKKNISNIKMYRTCLARPFLGGLSNLNECQNNKRLLIMIRN
jgi:hypothetical protein